MYTLEPNMTTKIHILTKITKVITHIGIYSANDRPSNVSNNSVIIV